MNEALEAVARLERDLADFQVQWFDAMEILLPHVRDDTVDAMYAAMSPRLQRSFLHEAQDQYPAFDAIVAYCIERGDDPAGWLAVRKWLYRQPFDLDPSLPLPTRDEARPLGSVVVFQRILPHFATTPIEDVLAGLRPAWRKEVADLAAGMRPGIDVIVTTATAHGQDPTPFHKLMEWHATLASGA